MTNPFSIQATEAASGHPRGHLALLVQEIVTAATRFRTGRQVAKDADGFRSHVKNLLRSADDEGKRAGYASVDVKYALYAVVAYVDETVLNSGQPAFDSWAKHPLQLDIFGKQVAGEAVFQYLTQLLARDDSDDLADVLEVYLLCLLLGFRGRYASGDQDTLDAITARVRERIDRIRGPSGELAPGWSLPPSQKVGRVRDELLRRIYYAAAGMAVMGIVLFAIYTFVLRSHTPAPPTGSKAAAGVVFREGLA
jgi:type VI secretion system protein ImpK